jgi:hypothetical protein
MPPRFELEWILPQELELMTHVALIDEASIAPHSVRAIGHGADEAEALLDLWMTLMRGAESRESIAFVATAYRRRTSPVRPGHLDRRCNVLNGHSVQRVVDALKSSGLVEGDAEGRLWIRPELESTVERCFNPTPSSKMLQLADELDRWADGQTGLIDMNGFQQRFAARVEGMRDFAVRAHGEADERLQNLNPSSAGRVRRIAEGLRAVAERIS